MLILLKNCKSICIKIKSNFQNAIRSHWAIEKKLHWILAAFCEDASRKRAGNATQNFSILVKMALNMLKKDAKAKGRVKSGRFKVASIY